MKHKFLIVLLAVLGMLGAFSIDTYLPSFHAISHDFGIGLDAVQQTLTVYLIAMSVMTLFHGTLSDVFGRRPVILWGVAIYTLSSFAAIFATNLTMLLACRLFQGLSVGVGMVVGRAIIRDRFSGPDAHRIMSHVTLVFGLAPVIAPVLGGWLQVRFGWHSVFVFLTLLGFLLVISCGWKLTESLPVSARTPLHLGKTCGDYRMILGNPKFVLQSLSLALSSSTLHIYISSAPAFIINILNLPETSFAWLFTPMISGIMLGAFVSGKVSHLWKPGRIIRTGFIVMGVASIINVIYSSFFTPNVPWAILPIMLCTFGMSFIAPVMTLITLDLYPQRRGLAASLQSAFMMGMFAFISGFVAPLLFDNALKLSLGALAGYVLCVLCWRWGGKESASYSDGVENGTPDILG